MDVINKELSKRTIFVCGIVFLLTSCLHLYNVAGDSQWLSFQMTSLLMLAPSFLLYIVAGIICFNRNLRNLRIHVAIALAALLVFLVLDLIFHFRLIPVLALYYTVSGVFDVYRKNK